MPKNFAIRTLTALLFAVLALSLAKNAAAQSVKVADVVNRTYGKRPDDLQPNWINHADCVGVDGNPDSLIFQATLVGAGSNLLQVWVGSGNDCSLQESRTSATATCWLVYSATPLNDIVNLPINARDIVGRHKPTDASNGPGSGTLEDCEGAGTSDAPTDITFYFLFVDGGGNLVGTFDSYQTKFDLLGPPPPTGISSGIGEDRLFVKWDNSSLATDLLGYKSYCQAAGSAGTGGTGTGGTTGIAGSTGVAGSTGTGGVASDASVEGGVPDASAGGASSSDGAAGMAGRAGAGGSGGNVGVGGGTGNPNCPSALVAGEIPDPQYECGSTTSKVATKVAAEGLTNFVSYAVAVAATDSVGNSGVLSQVVCGKPEPIDDFYELYTRAGGKGGGGFCALGADPANGVALLLLAACGALFVRRRIRG